MDDNSDETQDYIEVIDMSTHVTVTLNQSQFVGNLQLDEGAEIKVKRTTAARMKARGLVK